MTRSEANGLLSMWNFDLRRLDVYRLFHPELGIDSKRIGPFLALKYEGVGYFNRAIGPADAFSYYENELLEFYDRGQISFRLSLTGDSGTRPEPSNSGFRLSDIEEYYTRPTSSIRLNPHKGWTFRKVQPGEYETFHRMYLQSFASPNCNYAEALDNLEHLSEISGLHFIWALYHDRPVGYGMWHWQGSNACLCGGGILSPTQRNEGHQALLLHRIMEARQYGCSQAVAVAKQQSELAENLKASGFRLLWRDEGLQWVGSLKRAKVVI